MEKIDIESVRAVYESIEEVWPEDNLWLQHTRKNIEQYIARQSFCSNSNILNAGSGGNTYGLANRMHHVDIAKNLIEHFSNYTVANIEKLPFESHLFSDVICVGSVLNYCEPFPAISELSRVLQKGGRLILEFDSSWSLEHMHTERHRKSVASVELNYQSNITTQWVFSPMHIKAILLQMGFNVVDTYKFHYLSGLHYGKHKNDNAAAAYARFDAMCRRIPVLHKYSGNVIFTCLKS